MQITKRGSRSTDFQNRRGGYVGYVAIHWTVLTHNILASLARIIVYSMTPDGVPTPGSAAPTPMMTPLASGANTPLPHQNGNGFNGALADYLSAPLLKGHIKVKTYRGGSKALDSLSKLIASTEGFFHPTNSGNWTNDVRSR